MAEAADADPGVVPGVKTAEQWRADWNMAVLCSFPTRMSPALFPAPACQPTSDRSWTVWLFAAARSRCCAGREPGL